MKLNSNEIELKGSWRIVGSSMESDDVCKRIEKLISEYLIEIGIDATGWNKLFQDPNDKRFWELSYPDSELQGGGAPFLKYLSRHEVQQKYQILKNHCLVRF